MTESKPLDKLDFLTLRLGHLHGILQEMLSDPSHAEHHDECTTCNLFRAGFEALMVDYDRTILHSLLADKFSQVKQSKLAKLSFTGSLTTLEKTGDTFIFSAREKAKGKTAKVMIQVRKEDLANMLLGQQEVDCIVVSEVLEKT